MQVFSKNSDLQDNIVLIDAYCKAYPRGTLINVSYEKNNNNCLLVKSLEDIFKKYDSGKLNFPIIVYSFLRKFDIISSQNKVDNLKFIKFINQPKVGYLKLPFSPTQLSLFAESLDNDLRRENLFFNNFFDKKIKRESLNFSSQKIEGIFVNIEETLIKDHKLNQELYDLLLEKQKNGRWIYALSEGSSNVYQERLTEFDCLWPVLEKSELSGAYLEEIYDCKYKDDLTKKFNIRFDKYNFVKML